MKRLFLALLILAPSFTALAQGKVPAHPHVKFETTEGTIVLELDGRRAPVTVGNFLELIDSGYFDGTIFHRVVPDFVVQGGGFTPGFELKESDEFIFNESGNGLKNMRGTIVMARQEDPHTAKAQFFINVSDNKSLDPQPTRWGFAVFGYVIEGMEVVDNISNLPTGPGGNFPTDVPIVPVVIKAVTRVVYDD